MGKQGDGEEDEEGLIGSKIIDNADAGRFLEDIDTGDDEQGISEVNGESDGDIARDVRPAANPCGDAAAP